MSNLQPVLDDLAYRINDEHGQVEAAFGQAVDHALKVGELLHEAKSAVLHGEWLPWLEANCRFSKRTAQTYMRLANELPKLEPEKAQRVAHLPFRQAIAELADPNPTHESVLPPDKPFDLDDPDWSGFAQALLDAPFNETDFDFKTKGIRWYETKLSHQLDLPATVCITLAMWGDYDLPALLPQPAHHRLLCLDRLRGVRAMAHGNQARRDRTRRPLDCEPFLALGRLWRVNSHAHDGVRHRAAAEHPDRDQHGGSSLHRRVWRRRSRSGLPGLLSAQAL